MRNILEGDSYTHVSTHDKCHQYAREIKAKLDFAHGELLRWRKDYDRLQRKFNDAERIVELCKEEIDHGFDLPSEIFDRVEEYYQNDRPSKTIPKDTE